jgi:hypothetical protein
MIGLLKYWSFVLMVILVAWRGTHWFARSGQARSGMIRGEDYDFHEGRSKAGLLVNLLLTFKLPRARYFRLRRENWFDRFSKRIRLSVEPQANEPNFDRIFYLDSDDDALIELLRDSPKLKSILVGLMTRLRRNRAKLIYLSAENGTLNLYMRVFSTLDPEKLRAECAAWLVPLLEAVRALPQGKPASTWNAPYELTRRISLGLFAFGGFTSTWVFCMSPDRLVSPWLLIKWSSILSIAVTLSLTLWALPRLGRASNRHRALLLWIVLTSIGSTLCCFVVTRAVNIHLDFREPTGQVLGQAKLLGMSNSRSRGTYEVIFHSDDEPERQRERMAISWFEQRRLAQTWYGDASGPALLTTHPGLLGFGWKEIRP